jgi:hypothetical protein
MNSTFIVSFISKDKKALDELKKAVQKKEEISVDNVEPCNYSRQELSAIPQRIRTTTLPRHYGFKKRTLRAAI